MEYSINEIPRPVRRRMKHKKQKTGPVTNTNHSHMSPTPFSIQPLRLMREIFMRIGRSDSRMKLQCIPQYIGADRVSAEMNPVPVVVVKNIKNAVCIDMAVDAFFFSNLTWCL